MKKKFTIILLIVVGLILNAFAYLERKETGEVSPALITTGFFCFVQASIIQKKKKKS